MLAAYGCGWFDSLKDCAEEFLQEDKVVEPNQDNVEKYKKLFSIYQEVYGQTKDMNKKLLEFRK